MTQIEQPFEELIIPRRDMFDVTGSYYRVYSDSKNYTLVEATSALDALRNNGISKAYKIERHNPMGDNVIQFAQQHIASIAIMENDNKHEYVATEPEKTAEMPDKEPLLAEPESELQQTTELKEVQTVSSLNSGLSNDEVEKLMNG